MTRDQLDQAIDHVAARLTHVTDDEGLALRIMETLPDRSGWSLQWLMPRLAFTAMLAVAIAYVVLQPFGERSTDVLRTEVVSASAVELAAAAPEHRTNVEPALFVRRTIVERPQNDRRTIDVPDFERSLPSLVAVAALEFDSLAPVSLPEDAPLTLAPLAIADLPLTAEPISPR